MIVVTGQRAGADRNALVGWVGGAVQVIECEPQRTLRGRVAFDLNVAALPALRPGRLVRSDNAAPTGVLSKPELLPRFNPGSRISVSLCSRATVRAKDTIWPGWARHLQDDFNPPSSAGARSWPSICSDAAVAIARRFPERRVRHTPRSWSTCSAISPRSTPSSDALKVTRPFPLRSRR